MYISEIQKHAHDIAVKSGWWDGPRTTSECLINMIGELSEAWEAFRSRNPKSIKIPPFSHLEEELADTIIRILDFAEQHGYNIERAIAAKMAYNKNRPYRHGNKVA